VSRVPFITIVQNHALTLLRKLRSVRHDQMHWLICLDYPAAKKHVADEMRRLVYLSKAVNDGTHYTWPGCETDSELIIALDIMQKAAGGGELFFSLGVPPCKLAFSVLAGDTRLSCGVFFPKPGEEWKIADAVEHSPPGRTAAIYLNSYGEIPQFTISRPHVFVRPSTDGGYEFIGGQDDRRERD
jgi:hypothetical protein